MKHILIYGNPVDGHFFVGPFEDSESARVYMAGERRTENIWIAELDAPHGEAGDPEWDDSNGDHPVLTFADWQEEVVQGNTRLGYRQWVGHALDDLPDPHIGDT